MIVQKAKKSKEGEKDAISNRCMCNSDPVDCINDMHRNHEKNSIECMEVLRSIRDWSMHFIYSFCSSLLISKMISSIPPMVLITSSQTKGKAQRREERDGR